MDAAEIIRNLSEITRTIRAALRNLDIEVDTIDEMTEMFHDLNDICFVEYLIRLPGSIRVVPQDDWLHYLNQLREKIQNLTTNNNLDTHLNEWCKHHQQYRDLVLNSDITQDQLNRLYCQIHLRIGIHLGIEIH